MNDPILCDFLRRQEGLGARLAAESDLLNLTPLAGDPPTRYLAEFRCKGLVKEGLQIKIHDRFRVGIQFGPDYLRRVDPMSVAILLDPLTTFLPNVNGPVMCLGHIRPGTGLTEILYQVFEILSGKKATLIENDALNREACQWARNFPERFPVDDRPLKKRRLRIGLQQTKGARHHA